MRQCKIAIMLVVLFFSNIALFAQGNGFPEPARALTGSYKNQFKYYSDTAGDMPVGAANVSNALMLLASFDTRNFATAFLINTYREDKKICMCTAGHFSPPTLGKRNYDIYMKYIAKASDQVSGQAALTKDVISSFVSTAHVDVVARANDNTSGDWEIGLVDPDELPVKQYATLGYVFNPSLYALTGPGQYYIMHHTWSMPQRVSDSLSYATRFGVQFSASSPYLTLDAHNARTGPGGIGDGSSGAPLINRYLLSPAVVGMVQGTTDAATTITVPRNEIPDPDLQYYSYPSDFKYTNNKDIKITKFSTPSLMAAIKKHCWAKSDSAVIEGDSRYKTSVAQDNTQRLTEFGQSRSVTSQAGLAAAADQSYGVSNPGAALLKASTLTISCPLATSTTLGRISGLAREINLVAGFEYSAAGNYMLDMNSVVPEPISSAISKSIPISIPTVADSSMAENFVVYPNPARDGMFYISFASSEAGSNVTVSSMEGKQVYKGNIGNASPYPMALQGLPKGTYLLHIYHQKTGKVQFSKLIVCL